MHKNPFKEVVRGVRFILVKYDPNTKDGKFFARVGIPVRCCQCQDYFQPENPDEVEILEVIAVVEQKVMLPEGLSPDYLENSVVSFWCKHCLEAIMNGGKNPELPMYQ
jgi:hypothetical protein